MKIVFLFNEFSLHNQIIERFVSERRGDTVSLVKIQLVMKGKSRVSSAQNILPKLPKRFIVGKFLEFISMFLFTACPKILTKGAVFRRLSSIAQRHGLPFRQFDNVMTTEALDFIREQEPDLVISLFHQIVKEPLISIPKIGFINIHPGVLPEFRGIQPYFWELAEGHAHSGATLHLIEDAGIDTGRVLAQVRYLNAPGISVQLNYFLTAQSVAFLLPKLVGKLELSELEPTPQPDGGSYYKWPDRDAFERLRDHGHQLISIGDLWRILTGKYDTFRPDEIVWSTPSGLRLEQIV